MEDTKNEINLNQEKKAKKNLFKKWWFWIIIAILILLIMFLIHIVSKPKFNIVGFKISKEVKEYQYSDDTVYYTGEGKITTRDTKGIYLVALKETLKQGRKFCRIL